MKRTAKRTDAVQEKRINEARIRRSKAVGKAERKKPAKNNPATKRPTECEGYGDLSRCRGCFGCKGSGRQGATTAGREDKRKNKQDGKNEKAVTNTPQYAAREGTHQFDTVIDHGDNTGEIRSMYKGKPITMTYKLTRSGRGARSRFDRDRSKEWGTYPVAPPKRKKKGSKAGCDDEGEYQEDADDKTYLDDPDCGYVYPVWDDENKCERKLIIKGIPKEIMDVLRETDHDDCLLQRYNEEELDYRARNGMEDGEEDANGVYHASSMDKYAHYAWSTKLIKTPEDLAIKLVCGNEGSGEDDNEEDPLPLETLKEGFKDGEGKTANQKYALRMSLLHEAIRASVTKKQWLRFYDYYWRKLQQKEIAAEYGEKEKTISKSICDARKNISDWYKDHGFDVPDKKKLRAEKKAAEEQRKKSDAEYARKVKEQDGYTEDLDDLEGE